jgi:sugar phosphate isomerase/epimerase
VIVFRIFLLFLFVATSSFAQKPQIGIAQSLEHDSLLYASQYRFNVESASKLVSPKNVSDEQFKVNLALIKKLKVKIYAFNLFIPGDLKLVGPEINEPAVLAYAETVLKRTQQAGVKMIVWGSGGARRVPEGFDPARAIGQFADIARKISMLAKKYDVMLALENLNSTETNFITTAEQAYNMVKQVDHPNFRLCVDVYHMLKENESPSIIERAAGLVVHCDIAEKENRTPPGVKGEDFREYLRALKKINYKGVIVVEGRWDDLISQAAPAYQYLKQQIDEVYKK